jgi:drug/metabolite transporter (DMT)-like permease
MNSRTALAFVFIGLLWGSAWIPTSVVLREIPPLCAGALRFAIAAVFMALLTLARRLWPPRTSTWFTTALFRNAFVLGLAALALPYALTVWAVPHLSPADIPVLYAFMPLVALPMSGESAMNAIPALVIGISGVVMLVAQGLAFSPAQLAGAFLVVCSFVLGAFSLNYAKKHLRIPDLLLSCAIQFAFAAVFLGVAGLVTERSHSPAPDVQAISWLLVLGILISGITLPLLYWLLTRVEAWQAALLQWISTLVAIGEAVWLLRARPSPSQAIGALAIIGAAVWLLSRGATVTPPATSLRFEAPPHQSLK